MRHHIRTIFVVWVAASCLIVAIGGTIYAFTQPHQSEPVRFVAVTVYPRIVPATPQPMPTPTATVAPSATPEPTSGPTETPTIEPTAQPTLEVIEVEPGQVVEQPAPQPAQPAQPVEVQPTTAPAVFVVGQGDSYPCQPGQVKGNSESKIYHVPWGQFYSKTRNDSVVCFDTEQQAMDAGYVKSKR